MRNSVQLVTEQSLVPSRRAFLRGVGGAFAAAAVVPAGRTFAEPARLNLALADRAVGFRAGNAAFAIAKTIGVTAVEIDFGRLGSRPAMLTSLNTTDGRQHLMDAAAAQDQMVWALAMNIWREQSFADHPRAVEFTIDAIHAANAIGVKAITLPIAHAKDLAIAGVRERCIENLKQLAPAAEAAGVTLAVDVACSAIELKRLLNAVGSSAVAAAVSATTAETIAKAFDVLGAARVAQIRLSIDKSTTPVRQLVALRTACGETPWAGWVVIDRLAASLDDLQTVGTIAQARGAVATLSGALTANFS